MISPRPKAIERQAKISDPLDKLLDPADKWDSRPQSIQITLIFGPSARP